MSSRIFFIIKNATSIYHFQMHRFIHNMLVGKIHMKERGRCKPLRLNCSVEELILEEKKTVLIIPLLAQSRVEMMNEGEDCVDLENCGKGFVWLGYIFLSYKN
ncbi:hypothetical protein PIB30_017221 [Stylosanthes scabra]|uniref:Uncharacterized protein n=1 Tax=Stylosanthes scabra TaxID=79078 RepID=A0ABU6Y895_9FABA|nr:hypothetical protein [Stylosanthes scabra]